MRPYLVLAHRYIGLSIAGFLFLSGLSGALISWQQELDAWLNPHWFAQTSQSLPRTPLDLVAQLEQEHPEIEVSYLPLTLNPGSNLLVWVQPSQSATALGYNQAVIDSQSGHIRGTRQWGEVSFSREQLVPILYKFHYSLLIPYPWGLWFLGGLAIVWFLDAFVALILAFPNPTGWRKSLRVRISRGRPKLVFDLHRSAGVWLWLLLVPFAFTAISMNLGQDLVRPLVNHLSRLSPSPFDRDPSSIPQGHWLSRETLVQNAQHWASQHGIREPAGAMSCIRSLQQCGVGFFPSGQRGYGWGDPWVYMDAHTGAPTSPQIPGTGSAGDSFIQTQLPIHSGRLLGLPGRIAVSVLGVLVAALSLTGVLIWWRRLRARKIDR